MRYLISFKTSKFDPSQEPPNEANPYAGHSVLEWLREKLLSDGYECTIPDYEDWGWYMDIENAEHKYMIGATCYWEEGDPVDQELEWLIQINKIRSLSDKLFGRNKMLTNDVVTALVVRFLKNSNEIHGIQVEEDKYG